MYWQVMDMNPYYFLDIRHSCIYSERNIVSWKPMSHSSLEKPKQMTLVIKNFFIFPFLSVHFS